MCGRGAGTSASGFVATTWHLRRPGARRPDQAGRTAFPPARWGSVWRRCGCTPICGRAGRVLEKRRRDPLPRHRHRAVAVAGLIFSWTALALLVWSALSRAVRLCRQHWGLGSALSARSPSLGFISARRSTVAFRSGSACCFRRATPLSPFWPGPASCCGGPGGSNRRDEPMGLLGEVDWDFF